MALALTVLAVGIWVAAPSPAAAQEKGAGAAMLIKQTPAQSSATTAVKSADRPANWCSKCRISLVKVSERPTKTGAAAESKLITRNQCTKCENVLATVGAGKLARTTFATSCEVCCKMDPECCLKNPVCCIVNAGAQPATPAVMAKN
jgi:hypothetical protein